MLYIKDMGLESILQIWWNKRPNFKLQIPQQNPYSLFKLNSQLGQNNNKLNSLKNHYKIQALHVHFPI